MREEEVVVFLMTLMILAGVAVLWMAMQSRRRIREMEHRERLAMIERGILPAPEVDPFAFEHSAGLTGRPASPDTVRWRTSGIVMLGLGLGMLMLITFAAGSPEVGLGIGGAFALLGAAFLVNAMLIARNEALTMRSSLPAAPPARRAAPPSEPPSNVGP